MEKISKSKTPKYSIRDVDGCRLELEPDGDGQLLVSVQNDGEDTWRVITVSVEQLAEMLAFGRAHGAVTIE